MEPCTALAGCPSGTAKCQICRTKGFAGQCLWRCCLVDSTCDIVSGAACVGDVVIDERERYQLGRVTGRLLVVANRELLTCVVLLFVSCKLFGLCVQGLQKFSCPLFLGDLVRCKWGFYLKAYLGTLFSFYRGCLWQNLQAEF